MSTNDVPVVVDANILFSALLRPGSTTISTVLEKAWRFVVTESVLVEIFRHKERILSASRLNQDQLAVAYRGILAILDIRKEASIPISCWREARELCRGVDLDDTPLVALTLAVDGLLWTGDKALKAGLKAKGFDRFFSP